MRRASLYLLSSLLLCSLAPLAVRASPPVPPGSTRAPSEGPTDVESIGRARAQLEAALLRQESSCRRSFWVNSCLKDVREAFRREAAELDQRQRDLETRDRQQRAQQAQERVRDKLLGLEDRRASKAPPLTDLEIEQRLEQARGERAEQAQERLSRQQQRQLAADQRNEVRERTARTQQQRTERLLTGTESSPASVGSDQTPSQAAR